MNARYACVGGLAAATAGCALIVGDVQGTDTFGADASRADAGHLDAAREARSDATESSAPRDAADVIVAKDAPTKESGAKDATRDVSQEVGPTSDGGNAACSFWVSTGGTVAGPGTQAKPYSKIALALAAAGATTAAADGGTAVVCVESGTYTENNLAVARGVTLLGVQGQGSTTLVGGSTGSCGTTTQECAITLSAGARLSGFTIAAPVAVPENGVVALSGASDAVTSVSDVTIEHFMAAGTTGGIGIVALGSLEVGPDVISDGNYTGLSSPPTATGTVHVAGTNDFSNNTGHGLDFNGAALLIMEGGTVNGSGNTGIRMVGNPPDGGAPLAHVLTGVTVEHGGLYGLGMGGVQSLTVRSSTFLYNKVYNFQFNYGVGSVLDLGESATAGNTFADPAAPTSSSAGIILCGAVPAALTLTGDAFSVCPPKTLAQATCPAPTSYVDIAVPMGTAVATPGCTVGP